MKYLLINLMFSNCLSGFCSWREKIIKINCQNSQSQTVNPIMNFSLTPVNIASAFPFFPLLLLFSWFLSLPQTVSFFPRWCRWIAEKGDILGSQMLTFSWKVSLSFVLMFGDIFLLLSSPKRMDTLNVWRILILMENLGRNVLCFVFQDEFPFREAQPQSQRPAAGSTLPSCPWACSNLLGTEEVRVWPWCGMWLAFQVGKCVGNYFLLLSPFWFPDFSPTLSQPVFLHPVPTSLWLPI